MENLKVLVKHYAEVKGLADNYKKEADKDNAQIKKIMLADNCSEVEVDGITAKISVSTKESFIEEALIQKIKELKVRGIIKKKEYVDMEALENAIYHDKINAAELAVCQERKEVVTLRISGNK